MKISFNWLKKYISLDESPEAVADLLTHSGLEAEGVEHTESIPGGLKKYVAGHVLTCEKHPGADKLSKTTVDVGNGTVLPVVCGAPNVAAGQKVVVALPGAEVRMEGKPPFVIQKTKIRGEVSEGMICAEDELGTGHSHDGILVLDPATVPGTPAAELFNIQSDAVIEIGLTPNRADAASHYGVARELKALLKRNLLLDIHSLSYSVSAQSPISVEITNPQACPRYAGAYIRGVKIGESPEWLKTALQSVGLASINNVVDVTNYVLHGLGQPLHAFDADKIGSSKIVVRTAEENSVFVTLDGKERKMADSDLVIADASLPMAIAGVFGGKDSGVSSETQNVFIESAYFNPDYVRKTAQRLGIKTDASFRFERGTNPDMVIPGLKLAVQLILEVAGGLASDITDVYPQTVKPFDVFLNWNRLHKLIGEELPQQRVREILSLLEITVSSETREGLNLKVPPYRVDVQREADVVEEILRIYGYNNISVKEHLDADFLASFPERDTDKTKLNLGRLLAGKGFSEIYTNSLISSAWLEEEEKAVKILNALSTELDVMRQSLIPSGLQVLAHNINRRQKDLKLYEYGYVYNKAGDKKYTEEQKLSVLLTGAQQAETWQTRTQPVAFYDLKNAVADILQQAGVKDFQLQKKEASWFSQAVEITAQKKVLGVFGQVSKESLRQADIKQDVFAAELNLDVIFSLKQKPLVYKELSRFPEVRRDLSLVIDKKVKYEEVEKLARRTEPVLLRDMNVFDVFEGEALGQDKKSYSVSYMLVDENKTLTDAEIDGVMTRLIAAYEKELGAVIRK